MIRHEQILLTYYIWQTLREQGREDLVIPLLQAIGDSGIPREKPKLSPYPWEK